MQIVRHFFCAIVLSPDLVPYRFLNLIVDPYSISKFVVHVFLQFVMTAFSREQMMTFFYNVVRAITFLCFSFYSCTYMWEDDRQIRGKDRET